MSASAIRVWDPFVRFIHWSVATLIAIEMLNEAGANPWHRYLGYAAGALVAMRLAWGLFGSPFARLASMAQSAKGVASYLRCAQSGKRPIYTGHNPLGAWMAFTLWTLTLVVVATGWILQLDAFWGSDGAQSLHAWTAYVLATCAVVHVGGALITSALQRTNLVKAMITGNKPGRDSSMRRR